MRILFIDDDIGFLNLMEGILRQRGFDVVMAPDGKQAREALAQQKFDVIVSDVFMPTLDGIRFHSFVRDFTEARDVPFIFISALDSEYVRGLAAKSPNDHFLQKPVAVEEMLALIDKVGRSAPGKEPGKP